MKKKKRKNSGTRQVYSGASNEKIIEDVLSVGEPLCESENLELVSVECVNENENRIIRVYLDKEGGIALDDCISISRELSDILEVNFEHTKTHRLEVSSPGIERPLIKEKDFVRFKGKTIKVRTTSPVSDRKNFTGVLIDYKDSNIVLNIDGEEFEIPFHLVKKAHITSGDSIC